MTTDQKPSIFVKALGVMFVLFVLGALVVTAHAFYMIEWKLIPNLYFN